MHRGVMFAWMQNQQRVLVTGGSGFVGTYVLHELISKGFQVCATRRETSNLEVSKKVFQHLNELKKTSVDFEQIDWTICDLLDSQCCFSSHFRE